MPQVVPFLVKVGTLVTFGAVKGKAALAIIGGIATVGTFAAARFLKPKLDMNLDDNATTRSATVRGTTEPQKRVYGETLISGPITYAQVSGAQNRHLHQVIALAGHELTAINRVYLDDDYIDLTNSTIYNSSTKAVVSGKYGPKTNENDTSETVVFIDTRLGAASQTAYANLRSDSRTSSEYLATHKGNGIASMYVRLTVHEGSAELWDEVGNPRNIKALVHGAKVYDPRLEVDAGGTAGANPTNASYVVFDDDSLGVGTAVNEYARDEQGKNPALIAADILMNDDFGLGLPASKIDWDSVITAADKCDQLVPVPTSAVQKRFIGSGVVFGTDSHRRTLEKILMGMDGELLYSQGKYIIKAGVYEAPTETITENDIVSAVQVKTSTPRQDRFNEISGLFIDPDENYKMMEFGPITVDGAYARDNSEVLPEEIKLPFTQNKYVAQRIAWKKVNQSFAQTMITVTVNLKGMRIRVGDRINLTLTDFESIDSGNWSPKIFKVITWGFAEDGSGVDLTLIEDYASLYDDPDEDDYSTIDAQGTITTQLPDVESPSSFTATSQINSIKLDWTNPADASAWEQIWIFRNTTGTTPTDSDGPITKLRSNSFIDQRDADGTEYYYWIQAVKYPNGTTPSSGNTNKAKSQMVALGTPASGKIAATKIGNAVMGEDSVDTLQIADEAIGSDQIDVTIESDNYDSSNQTGWQINKNGNVEFNSGNFRGTLTVGSTDLTESNTLNSNTSAGDVGLGNVDNSDSQGTAQSGLISGVTINGGGITFSSGGALKTLNKDNESDTTNGFFLGYNTSSTKYTFGVGDSNQSIVWDGTDLTITGDVTADSFTLSSGATITDTEGQIENSQIDLNFPVDGLAHYWPCNSIADLDGDGDEELQDAVGGKTGVHSGTTAPTVNADSPSGKSVVITTNSGFTLLGDADADAIETANGFAWSLWFKSDTNSGNADARIITRDASDGWALLINQNAATQTLTLYGEPDSESLGSVTSGGWHHFCLSEDGSGTITGYIDGEKVATESYTPVASARPVVIGCNTEASIVAGTNNFEGKITEIRAYNRALTATEVRALFKVPTGGLPQEIDGDLIVSDSITASQIKVSNLQALSSDLGAIDAGSINIGSSTFVVGTDGAMTATSATITGGITATSLTISSGASVSGLGAGDVGLGNVANQNAQSTAQSGLISGVTITGGGITMSSGGSIKGGQTAYASGTGFFLGYDTDAYKFSIGGTSEYMKWDGSNLLLSGSLNASSITVGSGADTAAMSSAGDIRFWAGSQNPSATTPFIVQKDGEVFARNLVLTDDNGNEYFNAADGFTDLAFTQVVSTIEGAKLTTFSKALANDSAQVEIAFSQQSNVTFGVKFNANFRGSDNNATQATARSNALGDLPDNFKLEIWHHTTSGFTKSTAGATKIVEQTYTRRSPTYASPTSTDYKSTISDIYEPELGEYQATSGIALGVGAVNAQGFVTLEGTITDFPTGTSYVKTFVSTTDSSYDTVNKVTSSASRTVTITDNTTDGGFVIDGDPSQSVGDADITGVTAGTNLTGGGQSGSVTLALASTITGNHTFSNDVTISGNLTVSGTTTEVSTTNLQVSDKNIELNFGSGDTSSTAHGAGITIQDAVDGSNDATILWDQTNSQWDFSHEITAPTLDIAGQNLTISSNGKVVSQSYVSAVSYRIGTSQIIDNNQNISVIGTISANGYNSSNWDTAYGWGDHSSAGYLTSLAFNNLTNKTSGTGDYSTSGDLVSGRGSGGVALTINDGYGNANVTFNHQDGVPEQAGQSARIEVNTDSTTAGTKAVMYFEGSTGPVTADTAVSLTTFLQLTHNDVFVPTRITHLADNDTYIAFDPDRIRLYAGGSLKFDTNNTYLTTAGGTVTGAVTIDSGTSLGLKIEHDTFANGLELHREHASNAAAITFSNNSGQSGVLWARHSDKRPVWRPGGTTDAHEIFTDNYHPNADKWTTERDFTITLTGDVTGTVTVGVDGSGDETFTIATTGGGSGSVDSIANFANNRVITASDADSLNGEANLTFDGTNLVVAGSGYVQADHLRFTDYGGPVIQMYDSTFGNAPTHDVMYTGYQTTLGDFLSLKVAGNSTADHGIIGIADNGVFFGRTNVESGTHQLTNSLTAPLDTNWARINSSGIHSEGNLSFDGKLVLPATGAENAPFVYVSGDTDTGLYRPPAANTIGITTGGTYAMYWNASGNAYLRNKMHVTGGSAASPSYTFGTDTNTGIYSDAADHVHFSAGGSRRAYINTSGIFSDSSVYTASNGDFRNYGGEWHATTGLTGNGFKFTNTADNVDALVITATGNGTFAGSLSATTKSFDIEHPTKEGMRLHHGSLEGPEHGVYARGKATDGVIELPDYWEGLVDETSLTVNLTPSGRHQKLYVEKIEGNKVYIKNGSWFSRKIDCFYVIHARRKDVDQFEVEYAV